MKRSWWYQITRSGRSAVINSTAAWVSGSLAAAGPAYCPSPGAPIGPQLYGKLRLRSTPLALPRVLLATPSGFIDSTR